jgi:predicted DsbA family dithiol-disulfide isomerase
MEAFRKEMKDEIHFVRVVAPMRSHQQARPAARAYLAAEKQGKGDPMAKALFAAISRDEEECRKLAQDLGLDMDQYDQVVKDPATDARLDETNAWAEATGKGVPLVWVRDQMIPGVPNRERLLSAYRRAVLSAAAPRQ